MRSFLFGSRALGLEGLKAEVLHDCRKGRICSADQVTDRSERFIAAEIVREAAAARR
jgi:GTPase Era involved in 16S rRNA processing